MLALARERSGRPDRERDGARLRRRRPAPRRARARDDGMKRIELDRETGLVAAQAGVTIGELLDVLVPAGWMVPVVPGTQHVSVGGAIASDIHGKNHGSDGTFGSHVESLALLTAAGEVLEVSSERERELFEATLGGMGLTGVIVSAGSGCGRSRARCCRSTPTGWHRSRTRSPYCPRRAVLPRRVARPAGARDSPGAGHSRRAPARLGGARPRRRRRDGAGAGDASRDAFPPAVLRPETVRAFNTVRSSPRARAKRGHPEPIGSHMFPLDVLDAWPRLYGPGGFVQYQLVVPYGAERVIEAGDRGAASRPGAVLPVRAEGHGGGQRRAAVVSDLGVDDHARPAVRRRRPRAALDRCDELVTAAGGRVYLSKDARMRPQTLEAMYPRLE